jgi:hypothetical protein
MLQLLGELSWSPGPRPGALYFQIGHGKRMSYGLPGRHQPPQPGGEAEARDGKAAKQSCGKGIETAGVGR